MKTPFASGRDAVGSGFVSGGVNLHLVLTLRPSCPPASVSSVRSPGPLVTVPARPLAQGYFCAGVPKSPPLCIVTILKSPPEAATQRR